MAANDEAFTLAARYHQVGDFRDAEVICRLILQTEPRHAGALHLLGILVLEGGRPDLALTYLQQAAAVCAEASRFHFDLARAYQKLGRREEAVAAYRQALTLEPDFEAAHNNLGNTLKDLRRLEEAVAHFERALRIRPDYPEAHNNLAVALADLGILDDSVGQFLEALRLRPEFPDAHSSLGLVLMNQGKLVEAAARFEQALALQPNHALARWNQAFARLLQGNFEQGWPGYEWRWQALHVPRRTFAQPRWDGSPLEGKTILVFAEQGLGDTLQFIRYLPLVQRRGGNVLFECQPALAPLLAGIAGVDRLVAAGAALPSFNVQVPLLSLPGLFGTTLATIPAGVPYLRANADRIEYWRKELEPLKGFKIGIAWQGNPEFRFDRFRSFPLKHFEPLARVEGVRLVSLQVGPGRHQLAATTFPVADLGRRFDPNSLADLAGALMNLDLVVTSDTAVPHLAGALGVPVWVALQAISDWRWLLERSDSPWYPTMRLFRQRERGDWGTVFERIAEAVSKRGQDLGVYGSN